MTLLALLACATHDAPLYATGSTTIIGTGDDDAVYILDEDGQSVFTWSHAWGNLGTMPLGATPGRITRAAGTVWITLPAARGVAVLAEGATGLVRVATLETGAEPLGIVARGDGERVYVALATEGEVREYDGDGTTLRTWEIDGHPSWLALRPDGDALYVGSALGGIVTWIDLASGDAAAVDLPTPLAGSDDPDDAHPLTPRVTGDPSVSVDGTVLAFPMLYVDNTIDATPENAPPVDDYYAPTIGVALGLFNPVVALIPLASDGTPNGPEASLMFVAGEGMRGIVRSYVSSVALAPDGELALATMEGSDTVVALSTDASATGGFAMSATSFFSTDGGPRGVSFRADDVATVDCFLDRTAIALPMVSLRNKVEERYRSMDAENGGFAYPSSPLPADVQAGRSLFYTAMDDRMSAAGAGVSCATCHFAGRNDGLSWNLEDGPRQTPSLAGGIGESAPFTWTDDVATVGDEVNLTAEGRMGGQGLSAGQASVVATYIESLRPPDVPFLGSEEPAVLRGLAVFARPDVGCASCHSGALYTDNLAWPMFGLDAVNTPSLRRVAATAPYLHDGRAATLRDVLALSVDGEMGDTSMLTEQELDDLEAFLRSL